MHKLFQAYLNFFLIIEVWILTFKLIKIKSENNFLFARITCSWGLPYRTTHSCIGVYRSSAPLYPCECMLLILFPWRFWVKHGSTQVKGSEVLAPSYLPPTTIEWVSKSCSVMSNSLQPHALHSSWNSPGQNAGVGGLSLLQGIFPTQGSNLGLLHCRLILYSWATREAQEYWSG